MNQQDYQQRLNPRELGNYHVSTAEQVYQGQSYGQSFQSQSQNQYAFETNQYHPSHMSTPQGQGMDTTNQYNARTQASQPPQPHFQQQQYGGTSSQQYAGAHGAYAQTTFTHVPRDFGAERNIQAENNVHPAYRAQGQTAEETHAYQGFAPHDQPYHTQAGRVTPYQNNRSFQ